MEEREELMEMGRGLLNEKRLRKDANLTLDVRDWVRMQMDDAFELNVSRSEIDEVCGFAKRRDAEAVALVLNSEVGRWVYVVVNGGTFDEFFVRRLTGTID